VSIGSPMLEWGDQPHQFDSYFSRIKVRSTNDAFRLGAWQIVPEIHVSTIAYATYVDPSHPCQAPKGPRQNSEDSNIIDKIAPIPFHVPDYSSFPQLAMALRFERKQRHELAGTASLLLKLSYLAMVW
jgi:hypothetical protein